jgi:hypothetical protein
MGLEARRFGRHYAKAWHKAVRCFVPVWSIVLRP